ncbi:SDR family NAD(P)-dependent oxidoreductase [Paenibacillus sp. CAU 1782]
MERFNRLNKMLNRLLFGRESLNTAKLDHAVRGKCIVITGASSGIGEKTALLLGDYEIYLVLIARRADRLLAIKETIEARGKATVTILSGDLRVEDDMERVLGHIRELPYGVDIVVSNAGLSIRRGIAESLDRYHDFTRTMAINYFAPVRLLLDFIPGLEEKGGQIINISTVNARLVPIPLWAAYQSSKSAFDVWLRSVSPELLLMGIAVTTLYLPLVKTPMIAPTEAYDSMPAMKPEHVASLIAKSMYTRKPVWRPWWLGPGELLSLLFGRVAGKWFTVKRKGAKRNGNG